MEDTTSILDDAKKAESKKVELTKDEYFKVNIFSDVDFIV
jgi:hypothetical protein